MPHMVAQEHMGYVNALNYGTARNSSTLASALSAIGSTPSTLILTLTGDGVWTLTSSVTIPANVILFIPTGVTVFRSTGVTLTLQGTAISYYANWETGPGTTVRGILNHVDITSIKTAHMHSIGITGVAQPPVNIEHPSLQTAINLYTDVGGGFPGIDINRSSSDDNANWRITNNDVSNALYFARPNGNPRMVLSNAGLWLGVGGAYSSHTHLLQLAVDDAFKPGDATWDFPSDARLKTVERPYTDGLALVLAWPQPVVYTYNGKAQTPMDGKEYVGNIGQDVQPLAPYMINTYQEKLDPSDAEPTDILSMNNSAMVYMLLNAVKELAGQISALDARIAALEPPALRSAPLEERPQTAARRRKTDTADEDAEKN